MQSFWAMLVLCGLSAGLAACEQFNSPTHPKKRTAENSVSPSEEQSPDSSEPAESADVKATQDGNKATTASETDIAAATKSADSLVVTQDEKRVTTKISSNPNDIVGNWKNCKPSGNLFAGTIYHFLAGGSGTVERKNFTDAECKNVYKYPDGTEIGAKSFDLTWKAGVAIKPYGFELDRHIVQFPAPDAVLYGSFLIEDTHLYFDGLYDAAPISPQDPGGSIDTRDIVIDKSIIFQKQ